MGGRETPGAQGSIINYELSLFRTQVVHVNSFGKFQTGQQMITPAVEYMIGCTTGQALLSVVVCLSPASQNGWETWFACTYGEDLAKLRAPVKPETSHDAVEYGGSMRKRLEEAETHLRKTSQIGPAAKYWLPRCVAAKDLRDEVEVFGRLLQVAGAMVS